MWFPLHLHASWWNVFLVWAEIQVHYCDHALSVVRPSSVVTFHIFNFSSETAERNSTKLDRKQDLNVLCQVCVFGPIEKIRWPPWPLICWDIFDFFSETTERNSTKLDRMQDLNVLYQVCALGPIEKQDGRPSLWLAETFSTFPLKPMNGIQRNLTGSKISPFLPSLCFLGRSEKQMAALAFDWLRDFRLLLWNRYGIQRNLTKEISTSSSKLVFFGSIRKTKWPPWIPLIGWEIVDFSSIKPLTGIQRNLTGDLNVLFQVSVFPAAQKNKMAALSDSYIRYIDHMCTQVHDMWPFGPLVVFYIRYMRSHVVSTAWRWRNVFLYFILDICDPMWFPVPVRMRWRNVFLYFILDICDPMWFPLPVPMRWRNVFFVFYIRYMRSHVVSNVCTY